MNQSKMADAADNTVEIPAQPLAEIRELNTLISLRRVELENAELRRELLLYRTLSAMGLADRRVSIDVAKGVALIRDAEE